MVMETNRNPSDFGSPMLIRRFAQLMTLNLLCASGALAQGYTDMDGMSDAPVYEVTTEEADALPDGWAEEDDSSTLGFGDPVVPLTDEEEEMTEATATTADETLTDEEELDQLEIEGSNIYIICLYGNRDTNNLVPRKCHQMKRNLEAMYPNSRIVRVDNPSEEQLENIERRVGDDIALLIVVTHSTPGPDDTWDVWDCPMQPEDIAEIFEDDWVIWNGCYSFDICEEADNILPVMPETGCVDASDDTWREIVRCLERTQGRPMDRNDVCELVFGEDWPNEDEEEDGEGDAGDGAPMP